MRILLDLYLEKNLGDDLFLVSILKRYPNHHFYVFTQLGYTSFEQDYPNLSIIKLNKYLNYLVHKSKNKINMMKRFVRKHNIDALVLIGGSIFIEFPNWQWLYNERLSLWNYFKQASKPVYIIGSNFGPYESEEFISAYENAFNAVTDICFRDLNSYNLFKGSPNIRLEADAVFALEDTASRTKPKTVGISIIDLEARGQLATYNESYISQISNWVNQFVKDGYKVTLLSFCKNEGDEKQIQKIIATLDSTENVDRLLYNGDVKDYLNAFSSFEKVIATRFHSIVLSILYKKQVFSLNYSRKSENLINDHQLEIGMASIEQMPSIDYDYVSTKFNTATKQDSLRESASRQFLALDQLLGE